MKKLLVIAIVLLVSSQAFTQNISLSTMSTIKVITCGPGQDELYSAFGHSAFRVTDPQSGIDWIYNYGVFDFDQPNFYLNFARGYLYYMLGKHDYDPFFSYYKWKNRSVTEQTLNLDLEQRQALFEFLEWNSLPENKTYRYDYFYDNCATKIRDVLGVEVFPEMVEFDGRYVEEPKSIRDLTDDYLTFQPWGDLGIDICLGLPMDKEATAEMYMFLPDYIERSFQHSSIQSKNGEVKPLVMETVKSFEAEESEIKQSVFTPVNVFFSFAALVMVMTLIGIFRNRHCRIFDAIYFLLMSFMALFLLGLWLLTDHSAAAWNFNLLWAWPPYVIGFFFLLSRNDERIKRFFYVHFWFAAAVVALWYFLPQQMNMALLPFALINLMRTFHIQRYFRLNAQA